MSQLLLLRTCITKIQPLSLQNVVRPALGLVEATLVMKFTQVEYRRSLKRSEARCAFRRPLLLELLVDESLPEQLFLPRSHVSLQVSLSLI